MTVLGKHSEKKGENLKSFERTTEIRTLLHSISGFRCSGDEVFAFMGFLCFIRL